ncbi:hypothetical protein [Pseudoalteromonas sp. BDTF-M6]|uniref:hypothetical protein n=1 Tax=Pseudoalteromonas sp. BDTF-M6 TaxID=2796132 RepID=UPI001BAE8014|nr:hypothetical protein [Pseudoalteromonas sp. BDTF-M6]MBS3796529.1 hypothetical protein [Pseudoalteromonas sp. BDTF-M6]
MSNYNKSRQKERKSIATLWFTFPAAGVIFKVMYRYILIALVLNLTGCSSLKIGENVVMISGKVADVCQLSLKTENDSELNSINVRDVSGSFSSDFVITADEGNYIVQIIFNNKLVLNRVVHYPQEVAKFRLGEVN